MWARLVGRRPEAAAAPTVPDVPPGWQWPVRLAGRTPTGVDIVLRPLALGDGPTFQSIRRANAAWLEPWDEGADDEAWSRLAVDALQSGKRLGTGAGFGEEVGEQSGLPLARLDEPRDQPRQLVEHAVDRG